MEQSTQKQCQQKQGIMLQTEAPSSSKHNNILPNLPSYTNPQQLGRKNNNKSQAVEPEALKLATTAVSLNMRLRSADMPLSVQQHALSHTHSFLNNHHHHLVGDGRPNRRPNPTLLARSLKKEFDGVYGPAWHCVVGESFGSYVTHSPGGFVYFSVDSFSVLLFKTEVRLLTELSCLPP